MKVRNIVGTTGKACKCGSWFTHYANFDPPPKVYSCAALGCKALASVGAHVKMSGSFDMRQYIVPFCDKHNKEAGDIDLKLGVKLVSANVAGTCEKQGASR